MTIELTTSEIETLLVHLMVRRNELSNLWQAEVPGTCIHEELTELTSLIYKVENQLYAR